MNQYDWLDGYLLAKPGCVKDFKMEWGWLRYQVGGRMFAAICQPHSEHSAYECRELVTLKCEPLLADALRAQYPDIVPGFYMDKQHWNSVYLDGELPEEELRGLCDRSYRLVFEKLTKKLQKELAESRI